MLLAHWLDFLAPQPCVAGSIAVINLFPEFGVRRPETLLPPLPQRAHSYTELFGHFGFRYVAGNMRDPLPLQPRRALLTVSFWHCRLPCCRQFSLSAVKGHEAPG